MVSGKNLIEKIYQELLDLDLDYEIFVKGKNGVSNIILFDEPELIPGEKSRFRIGNGSIIIFDGDKPILGIEIIPNEPTPPKDMAGPIPVYMVTRKIKLNYNDGTVKEYDLSTKFPLIVVVPDQSETKRKQIHDLNEKFRGILNLGIEYSALNDFVICVDSDFSKVIKKI